MRTFVVVLGAMACLSTGRRKHTRELMQVRLRDIVEVEGNRAPLKLLAMLLVEANPAAYFTPSHWIAGGMPHNLRLQSRSSRAPARMHAATEATEISEPEGQQKASGWNEVGLITPKTRCLIQSMRDNLGIVEPNELQVRAVPVILEGEDVILSSFTGSGKTLAGLLPLLARMLHRSNRRKPPRQGDKDDDAPCTPELLVIAPTTELSLQIHRVLDGLTASCPELTSINEQESMQHTSERTLESFIRALQPRIVVGTVKDLLLLTERRALDITKVQYLMIDEVDMLVDAERARLSRVLDMLPSIETVHKVLASASALAHPDMKKLIPAIFPNGYKLFSSMEDSMAADEEAAMSLPPTLRHAVLEIRDDTGDWASGKSSPEAAFSKKFEVLMQIIQHRDPKENLMVFVNKKKASTMGLQEQLKLSGVKVELLSGLRRVRRRNVVVQKLIEEEGRVVVATDETAARGLDYESINMIVNFDVPYGVKNYLHRAGRTGRAGREGTVVSFVSNPKELRFLTDKLLGRFGVQATHRLEIDEDGLNFIAAQEANAE